jgi:cell division protein FtsB
MKIKKCRVLKFYFGNFKPMKSKLFLFNLLSLSLLFFFIFFFLKSQMAVFNQIKNFIKTSYLGGQKYEAAARIVQEELKAKSTMPNYPELGAYQLTAKLGE